jgi:hypothetical protein
LVASIKTKNVLMILISLVLIPKHGHELLQVVTHQALGLSMKQLFLEE